MDKILKFLERLNKKERKKIYELIDEVLEGDVADLLPRKLKGFSGLYRIRVNKIRIVFRREKGKNIIVNIDYRKNVYRKR